MSSVAAHAELPRLLAGLRPGRQPMSLAEHEQSHGPLPQAHPAALIEEIELSGLRGRGGADFPAAVKLRAVASRGRARAVVVNGSETEPASGKDSLLLSRLPHLVLDGAVLAAQAVGAAEVVVKLPDGAQAAQTALETAMRERRERDVAVGVALGTPGYVSGEESAVIEYLNGGEAIPRFVPPRPFERGYRNRPTLVQNPETLAQIALVARFGHRWYRELGTDADPGSALVTISGAVRSPGVYELAFGTPLTALIEAAGGATESLQALLVGGYFGTWVPAGRALTLRLAREDLRGMGATLGSGVLIALGGSACGLHESARIIDYLAAQSAGQCGPCVFGLGDIATTFGRMVAEGGAARATARLRTLIGEVEGRGACHHPNGALRFAESALGVFGADVDAHARVRCAAPAAGLPLGPAPNLERAREKYRRRAAGRRAA